MAFLDNKEVGNRLREKREALGFSSKRKYAIGADVDQSQYSKIEKGELPITENILEKLTATYNIDKDWILYGTDVPHENRGQRPDLLTEVRNLMNWKIEAEVKIEVLMETIKELMVSSTKKSAALISAELSEAVDMALKMRRESSGIKYAG